MRNLTTIKISAKDVETIKKNHNVIVIDDYESWIVDDTITIKSITLDEDDQYILTDYCITNEELRRDNRFAIECLTNDDVNHALDYHPEKKLWRDGCEKYAVDLGEWISRKTDLPPVSPCGMYNYVVECLGFGYIRKSPCNLFRVANAVATHHDVEFSLLSVDGNRISVEGYDEADAMDIIVSDDGYTIQVEYYVRDHNGNRPEEPSWSKLLDRNLFRLD